jgi:hypothetical protein
VTRHPEEIPFFSGALAHIVPKKVT